MGTAVLLWLCGININNNLSLRGNALPKDVGNQLAPLRIPMMQKRINMTSYLSSMKPGRFIGLRKAPADQMM